ncbi:MAG: hypothetical protein NTX46_03730 [Chloroflexi bacterium]|nr:hypothetical protein [Chloroflexota bacterium]
MQTNVAQLLKAPVGSIRVFQVNNTLEDDGGSQHLIQGELTLTRTNDSILVQGTLATATELTCSRCLKPFTCNIPLHIEEEFLRAVLPLMDIMFLT